MNVQRHHTSQGVTTALIVTEARKWMTVLIVDADRLRLIREPVTEKQYMTPLETNQHKGVASLRRLARKAGTSREIRAAVADLAES